MREWNYSSATRASLLRPPLLPYTDKYRKNDDVYSGDDCSRSGLSVPDYCSVATKREGSGLGGRVWRHGFADGIRPARVGDVVVEGDDDLGGALYGHQPDAFGSGDEERRIRNDGPGGSAPGADRSGGP